MTQPAFAATVTTPWPANPNWQQYVEAPSSPTICPTAVTSSSGSVTGAQNLVCGGNGGATLTYAAGGTAPTVVLDYGKDVGGLPFFTSTAETGSPNLQAAYSERLLDLTTTGDAGAALNEGDSHRYDTYPITAPGTVTNASVQGGERYEEITLTTPGTLTLSKVGINYIADRTTAYPGHFLSSSDVLNKLWYAGAYTTQLDSVPSNSLPSTWADTNGALVAQGGVGLLGQGSSWTDYTASFDTAVVTNQSGWVVRSQDPNDGYLFILDADNDSEGAKNTLQEFDLHGGVYTSVGSVAVSTDLVPGAWHTVSTTVAGSSVSVSLDGKQVSSLVSTAFPSGSLQFANGTIGFRESGTEVADYRNLTVTSSSGASLYSNALGTTASLSDFAAPGTNVVPSILDGAKRDRAIWTGDMNVEGPTVYDSTNASADLKGSLQLVGSYQQSNGFIPGLMNPQNALHTGAPTAPDTGSYSADYSMYWVLALGDYYLYTGDTAFMQQEFPVLQAELAWNASQVDANGLFTTNQVDGRDWDYYDGARTGEVTEYNLLYYKALSDASMIATGLGSTTQATAYDEQASALEKAINAHLWNATTGTYYTSDSLTTGIAQDANSLALLYGMLPKGFYGNGIPAGGGTKVLDALKQNLWTTPYGPVPYAGTPGYQSSVSPFASGYELDARYNGGDTADAEQLMQNVWGPMLAPGPNTTGTLWETVSSTDGTPGLGSRTSLAHGWATSPTSALTSYVLGIQPTTPGYKTMTIAPQPGDLSWAEGQAPTPAGPVKVSWANRPASSTFDMSVTVPAGEGAWVTVPTQGISDETMAVNGALETTNGSPVASPPVQIWQWGASSVELYVPGGHTYAIAVNSGDVPATPPGYTLCAAEGGTCSVTGPESMAFGAHGHYFYKIVTGATACSNDVFGDPDYGFAKSCYVGPVIPAPAGMKLCAPEGLICTVTGSVMVNYGAGVSFTQGWITDAAVCENPLFDRDPDPGVTKACFIAGAG